MFKVVIVEDEEIIRKSLSLMIQWEALDCTVEAVCENGEDGAAAIRHYQPDIVITDVVMPIKTGLEMIEETCEEVEYSAIILSGYSDFAYAQTAVNYGAVAYLLKPIRQDEMVEAIAKAKDGCQKRCIYRNHQENPISLKDQFLAEMAIEGGTPDPLLEQMLEYVHTHYQHKIVMNDLVQEMHYSDTFLNKRFKEATGTTLMEYVNRYRIGVALDLMLEDHMSLPEIADACGIGEYKYFSIVFKKYLGYTPKEFQCRTLPDENLH